MAEAPIVSAGVAARAFILLAMLETMLSHATQIADAKTTRTSTTTTTTVTTTTTTATTNSSVSSENAGGQVSIVKSENSTVYNHTHSCRYKNVTNPKYRSAYEHKGNHPKYIEKLKKKKERKDCGLSAFPDDIDRGVKSLTFTAYAISETVTHLPAAALRGLTSLRHFEFMVTHLKTAEQGAFDDLLDLENFTGPFLKRGALPGYISSDAVTSACAAAELQGRALYDTDLCIFGESAAASSGEIAYIAMAAVVALSVTAWIARYLHRRKDGAMKRNEYMHVLLYGFRIFDLLMDYAVFAFTMQTRAFDRLREGDTVFQSGNSGWHNSTCYMKNRTYYSSYDSYDDDRDDGSGYGSGEATGDDDDMYLRFGIDWAFWPAFSLTSALIGTLLFIPDTFVFSKKYGWAEHGLFTWSSPSPLASKCLLVTTMLLETVPQIIIGVTFLIQQLHTVAAVSLCFSMLSVLYEVAYFTKLIFKEHGSICRELSCFICWPFYCLFGMWGDETIGYALEDVDVVNAELGGEKCGETYCTYGRDLGRCTAWTLLSGSYCVPQCCYCAFTHGCTEEEKKKKCGYFYGVLSEQWCFCADGPIGPNGEGRFIEAHPGVPIGGMLATDSDVWTALTKYLCCDFLEIVCGTIGGQSCADLKKINAALRASSEKEGGNCDITDGCITCAKVCGPICMPCSWLVYAYSTYAIRSKMKKAYGIQSYGWKDQCEGILCGLNPYCCGYTLKLQIDQMVGHLDQFPIENVDKNNEHFHRRWERPQGRTATPPQKAPTQRTMQVVSNEAFAADLKEDTPDLFGFTVSEEPTGVGGANPAKNNKEEATEFGGSDDSSDDSDEICL